MTDVLTEQSRPPGTSPAAEIDRLLAVLSDARHRWRDTPLAERIRLARQCGEGVFAAADDWVAAACQAKGIAPDGASAGEEIAAGPLAVLRYLKLLIAVLSDIDRLGAPRLPGAPRTGPDGRLRVPVFPARGLYDSVLFPGYHAYARLVPEIQLHDLADRRSPRFQRFSSAGTALVLGAGNVSSIPAVDALTKLFQDNRVVLLKLNPVNDYLAAIFERAFHPLISAGFLKLCHGGGDVGSYAAQHEQVDEVHVTGSLAAHESIVWGPSAEERETRKAEGLPLLEKPITSELGNVTPWVVVPGAYSERQLDFQAENVAAMIINNASFNCIAAKLIVTCKDWADRGRFLDKVQAILDRTPRRRAYYPGARDRYRRFTGREPDEAPPGTLPWTIVKDIDPDSEPRWVREESFVCVCAETALHADSPADFLDRAVEFVNERVWGTLGFGLTVHPDFRRSAEGRSRWESALDRLRYGVVGVNVWPGLAYATMCIPWGGYPSATLRDPQSGLGWVHNPYFLAGVEKSVLEGPLVAWPKPLWFPSHRQSHLLARRVLGICHRPALWKLSGLAAPALLS
ncbi:MAG TPA: aldehyde dehydrogenase family protein [Pirellulales bacterium]|jgi:acyl-CoA reductase-like NAD-dependent aldehyde dehydrogenase|nr:aldehyde dehydrogenase family protein [Pirellulales bacterium]